MDFEQYTDRAKGFVQAAQSLALREGHQQFAPEHLLKVLLDDPEGLAAGLIRSAPAATPRTALAAVEAALAKRPKVSGGGAGQIYLAPELARVFDQRREDRRQGRRQVRHRRAAAAGAGASRRAPRRPHPGRRRRHARRALNTAINEIRKGRTADSASAEQAYDALKRYARDLTEAAADGQARSRSSAATRRSAAPSRCCRGAPRTIPC